MIEQNLSPIDYTLADLCNNRKLFQANLGNLSLLDSKSLLKMLRVGVNRISHQLNEDRKNPGVFRDASWRRKATTSQIVKQDMIIQVNAHINRLTQVVDRDEPITLTIENTRLKKKLAKRELRVSYIENERKILFDYLRSRCSEEFMLELCAEVDREAKIAHIHAKAEKCSTGSI